MADKPVLSTLSGNAVYSAVQLNAIMDELADAIEGCLGLGGTSESPNSMTGGLDMGTYKITNLADPVADQDAVTKAYIDANYGEAATSEAIAAKDAALVAQAAAEAAADFVDDLYLGAHPSPPSTDNDGDAIQVGATYFNSGNDTFYVWTSGLAWAQAYTDATATPSASETVEGKIEIATDAEAAGLVATNKALVPSNLSPMFATEAEMESETANKFVTPDVVINSPGVAKAMVAFDGTTNPPTIKSSYNVSSITDNGAGDYVVNLSISFNSTDDMVCMVTSLTGNSTTAGAKPTTVSAVEVSLRSQIGLVDKSYVALTVFGDI